MVSTIMLTLLALALIAWYGKRQRTKGMDEGSLLLALAFVKFCNRKNFDVSASLKELRSCIQLVQQEELEQEEE